MACQNVHLWKRLGDEDACTASHTHTRARTHTHTHSDAGDMQAQAV